jgi:hypothetical protein
MKYFGVIFIIFLSIQVFSQSGKQYFGQALIEIKDEKTISSIQLEVRKNPNVKVVRIDPVSGQILLITNELASWSEKEFISIFGENSSKLNCVFIGVYGIDHLKTYPFKDCE